MSQSRYDASGSTKTLLADIANKILPSNYVIRDGILLEDFSVISGWTDSSKLSLDTSIAPFGNASTKFTETTAGATTSIDKTVNWNIKNCESIGIWFTCDTANLNTLRIYVSSMANLSKYYTLLFNSVTGYPFKTGLNYLKIPRTAFTNSGSDNFINTMVKIRFNVESKAGQNAIVNFHKIEYNQKSVPSVMFSFDDGENTVYNNIFEYMRDRGVKASVNIVSDLIGQVGRFTTVMLDDMYDAGWDICPHAKTAADYNVITNEQVIVDATTVRDYILGRGYVRGAYHWAYPNGSANDAVIATLQGLGVLTGRVYSAPGYISTPTDNMMKLFCQRMESATTGAGMIAMVKNCINYGGMSVEFAGHSVVTSVPSGLQILDTELKTFIDWLVANKINVVTKSEWYNQNVNPRFLAAKR